MPSGMIYIYDYSKSTLFKTGLRDLLWILWFYNSVRMNKISTLHDDIENIVIYFNESPVAFLLLLLLKYEQCIKVHNHICPSTI